MRGLDEANLNHIGPVLRAPQRAAGRKTTEARRLQRRAQRIGQGLLHGGSPDQLARPVLGEKLLQKAQHSLLFEAVGKAANQRTRQRRFPVRHEGIDIIDAAEALRRIAPAS